eukprot:scaffold756_cov281-Pinguiococcus_pyrenoidosus.AAC.2
MSEDRLIIWTEHPRWALGRPLVQRARRMHAALDLYDELWDAMVKRRKRHLDAIVLGVRDRGGPTKESVQAPNLVCAKEALANATEIHLLAVKPEGRQARRARRKLEVRDVRAIAEAAASLMLGKACVPRAATLPVKVDVLLPSAGGVCFVEEPPCAGMTTSSIALGGTFDHLHNGHKRLLTVAAHVARDDVLVGITDPAMLAKKSHRRKIESFEARSQRVESVLRQLGCTARIRTVRIRDAAGPLTAERRIRTILVTSENLGMAHEINVQRRSNQLPRLRILCLRRTREDSLSSSELRKRQK